VRILVTWSFPALFEALSRPPDIQCVDLLGTDVTRKNRGTARCDVEIHTPGERIYGPAKLLETGDCFHLVVGESEPLNFLFRAARREI
jgi:hypothetical protein